MKFLSNPTEIFDNNSSNGFLSNPTEIFDNNSSNGFLSNPTEIKKQIKIEK